MRVKTEYMFDLTFTSPNDALLAVEALRDAAAQWATCSNESEPLLTIAEQITRQLPA